MIKNYFQFQFRFLNSFMPLFYTAFYECDFEALQNQVAALVMLRQIGSNAAEFCIPYMISKYQQANVRNKFKP